MARHVQTPSGGGGVHGARRSGSTSDICSGLHDDHASHQYVRRGTDGSMCGTASPLTTLHPNAAHTPRHVRAAGYMETEAGRPLRAIGSRQQ